MGNILSKKFTTKSLLKFTIPTIIMMVFMSLYTMVDGIFVANLIGPNALSAVNIAYPAISIIVALAIMLATGGSAVVARKMGEGKSRESKENLTLLFCVGIGIGFLVLLIGCIFTEPIIKMLGASEVLYEYTYDYLKTLMFFSPFAMLQMLFQYFFVTAGKPKMGLFAIIGGGIANIILDYVFIAIFNMGIAGAAVATGIGYCIPAVVGLYYFTFKRNGTLYFVKPKIDIKMIIESCLNGSSEMVTNLAMAITTFLFNIIMLRYLGEDGVAAITIVLYSQFLLTAVYLGFSSGVAPIISYNYGEGNQTELKKLFKISMLFITISSVIIFAASIILSPNIVSVFAKADTKVFEIAINGFLLFAISYLFTGFNIFASSMFTALSNGKVSAIISFVRTFVFLVVGILFLPVLIGENGIWLAVPAAEILTIVISFAYMIKLRKHYHYA